MEEQLGVSELLESESKGGLIPEKQWEMIKDFGKGGLKNAKAVVLTLLLFGVTNIALIGYGTYRIFAVGFEWIHLLWLTLVIVVGVGISAFAGYRAYQFAVMKAMKAVYDALTTLFQKICEIIVDRAEAFLHKGVKLTKEKFAKAIDIAKVVNEQYKKIPKLVRMGIIFIMRRLPLIAMLQDTASDVNGANKKEVSINLHKKLDDFVTENIFEGNGLGWIFWLLPLNILVLIVIIHLQIV